MCVGKSNSHNEVWITAPNCTERLLLVRIFSSIVNILGNFSTRSCIRTPRRKITEDIYSSSNILLVVNILFRHVPSHAPEKSTLHLSVQLALRNHTLSCANYFFRNLIRFFLSYSSTINLSCEYYRL